MAKTRIDFVPFVSAFSCDLYVWNALISASVFRFGADMRRYFAFNALLKSETDLLIVSSVSLPFWYLKVHFCD